MKRALWLAALCALLAVPAGSGQLRPPPVKKLSQLTELVRTDAPLADATKALFRLGQPLIGGSASGTLVGGRQPNGAAYDLVNWQGTDSGGTARNRWRVTPQGAFTLGDIDCTSSSITLLGNNTGGLVTVFGITGGVPYCEIYDAGAGCTKIIGRTDHNSASYASLTLPVNGSQGWLMQGRGSGILLGVDASLVDRFAFDATGHGILGNGLSSLNASAAWQVDSTTRGQLPPRMTTAQRTAIATPAEGLIVYDLSLHKLECYDGTTWQAAW